MTEWGVQVYYAIFEIGVSRPQHAISLNNQ
jgi:hypothetical protein